MRINRGAFAAILALCVAAPAAAQTKSAMERQVERARERCKENRGANCDTSEGLREWRLQERSRSEAVREGSRHRLPPQPPTPKPKS